MKRRTFILSLLSTPLLSNLALSNPVTESQCVEPDALQDPRVLIVCPTYAQAHEIWKRMKYKEQAMCIGVGTALCGRQFDYIIVDEAADLANQRTSAWINEAVRPGLSVRGEMISLRWDESDSLNYGAHHAVNGFFTAPGKQIGVGARRWPAGISSPARYYQAKAELLDWYIETRGIV